MSTQSKETATEKGPPGQIKTEKIVDRKQVSSFAVSLVVHLTVLLALHFLFTLPPEVLQEVLPIESVIDQKKRDPLDVVKKLDTQKEAATTFNTTAGSVSAQPGGTSRTVKTQQKLPDVQSDVTTEELPFTPSDIPTPGEHMLSDDLGEGEIRGSPQRLVRGYGSALDELTQELIRMMRQQKLLVVWLFDESGSMKDDQKEIKQRIGRVFEELKIVDREAENIGISKKIRRSRRNNRSLLQEIMLTSIASFGESYHQQTKTPTPDLQTIMNAIDAIPVDESGKEHTSAALMHAINRHKPMAARNKRKLVLIVISDESGDDMLAIEDVIRQCKILKAPVYVLGRESVFGSLYAHVEWTQPETGRVYYLPIRRGPETPFAELLQHDGFRRRRDSHMSGFGPYDQVRLCRETGGIFFQLPHEQQDLHDFEQHKYAALALREYLPDLTSRSEYARQRNKSEFRKAIWNVIVLLNPYNKQNKGLLELPDPRYQRFSTDPRKYGPKVAKRGKKILTMLSIFEKAIKHLENVEPLRTQEPSRRWRANYDLIRAQLYWYQLRLFEYGIAMDQFVRKGMKQNPKHNRWYIRETSRKLVLPDEINQKRFKITPEELKEKYHTALARLEEVSRRHEGTPWAKRAKWERKRPFGAKFGTYYQAPPKRTKRKRRPKPTPPPKL